MWIYPLGDSYSADQECQDWYRRNLPLKEERLAGFQRLPQCPCSWWWLWGNWRWAYWRDDYNVMCFRMTVGRSRQLAPYGKVGGHSVSLCERLVDTVCGSVGGLVDSRWLCGKRIVVDRGTGSGDRLVETKFGSVESLVDAVFGSSERLVETFFGSKERLIHRVFGSGER